MSDSRGKVTIKIVISQPLALNHNSFYVMNEFSKKSILNSVTEVEVVLYIPNKAFLVKYQLHAFPP